MRFQRVLSSLGAAIALSAGLLLAGCGGDPSKQIDAGLSSDTGQTIYGITCTAVNVLDDFYHTYVAENPEVISAKAQNYIALAEAALVADDGSTNICTAPYPTDVATLTSKVSGALLNIYKAFKEQGLNPAVTLQAAQQAAVPPATQ